MSGAHSQAGPVDPPRASSAGGLSLPIRCPQCGIEGLVGWTSLQNGIRCPQCDCDFVVARGGRVVRLADMPHVRFACPRCQQTGNLPAPIAARSARCPACRLPLARGPDQRLYGVGEAAELWKVAPPGPRRDSRFAQVLRLTTTPDGRFRPAAAIAAASVIAIAALVGALVAAAYFDRSPEALAKRLTEECLRGAKDSGVGFIEEDAVQLVELERWRKRHFASIIDRHRPDGDGVAVSVTPLPAANPYRVLAVTLKSPFLGNRNHIQCWRDSGEQWQFDARATLAAEDGFGSHKVGPTIKGRGAPTNSAKDAPARLRRGRR